MSISGDIKVNVCVITYNHEEFIEKALASILNQKADFDFDIVIGDDCSSDKTKEIILKYKQRYPDLIRILFSEKNIGMRENFLRSLKACKGKYIAILEGDDYWTDEYKLQKQFDYLEKFLDLFRITIYNLLGLIYCIQY